jgi:hypothetical protein
MSKLQIPWRYLLRSLPAVFAIGGLVQGNRQRSVIFGLVGILAVVVVEQTMAWWSRFKIKSWPSANALIEFARVTEDDKGGPSDHVLELSYSYQVGDERFGGAYRETFRSEEQAKRSLRFFEDLPMPVRYDPRDPSRSVLDPHWLASLAKRPSVTGATAR